MSDQLQSYNDVMHRAWADETFKNRFVTDPKTIMAEIAGEIPDSVKFEVHEDTSDVKNFVLPQKSEMEGVNPIEGNPIIGAVVQRALADESFKSLLLQNPKAALKQETNTYFPEFLTIHVYEDTPTLKHLVLPRNLKAEELSDLELEAVAGGKEQGQLVTEKYYSSDGDIIGGGFTYTF